MIDYDQIAQGAYDAVNNAGQSLAIRVTTPGTYNPATGVIAGATTTDIPCVGVVLPPRGADYSKHYQDGTLVQISDLIVIIPSFGLLVEPAPGNIVMIGLSPWTILSVETLAPAGTGLIFKCFVRRP